MFNKVILVGRITHDPEIKIANDKQYLDFQLAVNRYGKDDKSDFFKVVCFGKTAEFVDKYVKKGNLMLIEGSLRDNQWTDEYGQKKRKTEIIAQRIQLLEKRQKEQEQLPSPQPQEIPEPTVEDENGGKDEIPF